MFKKHYAWKVRIEPEGGHFRIYYQHDFPRGVVEEERDPRHFNSLEEAEQFAEGVCQEIMSAVPPAGGQSVKRNGHHCVALDFLLARPLYAM